MRVVLSRQSKAELRDIALFIARDNKTRALTFTAELRQKALDIGKRPLAFRLVPRLELFGIRRRLYRDYVIFFRIESDRIVILHFVHGARDLPALL